MEVAVVGGGIAGLFTAYYLREEGAAVTVFESGSPGQDSIHAAGILEPENFYRTNTFSYLRRAMRYWRNGSSSFRSVDRHFVLRYLTSMGQSPSAEGWVTLRKIADDSTRAFRALAESRNDFGLTMGGLEEVYETRSAFEAAARSNEQKQPPVGFELKERPGHAGVIRFPEMGWLQTELFVERMLRELEGTRLLHATVESLGPDGRVGFAGKSQRFDVVVAALGVASRRLGVPITGVKGYGWHALSRDRSRVATIFAERGIASVPLAPFPGQAEGLTHLKVTGGWDFDLARSGGRADAILREATQLCDLVEVRDLRFGHRPCAPDGLPVVGRMGQIVVVTGGFRLGWSYAPGMGRLGAALALGQVSNDPFLARYCPRELTRTCGLS